MGELHSMAYSSSLHGSSLLSWDLQNLGVFNADMSLVMDESAPFVSPLLDRSDDLSTGYLEDALVEYSERSKRRRLLLFSDDDDDDHQTNIISKDFAMPCWNNSNSGSWGLSENFSCMSQIPSFNGVSDELRMSTSVSRVSNEEANFVPAEIKTPEEINSSAIEALDSSSSANKTRSIFDKDAPPFSAGVDDDEKRKKRVVTRVVYPFALVKPGGKEGDVTLHDINERILMPPTRPVRHPVGDFACRPCVSADGPGLSGKAVVALTRIHTQGSGTITIIRTKG